jgi:glycosyltransferase involved in cell wall biosynthesis
MFLRYVNKMRADYVVYHAYDMYDHAPGWSKELEFNERALLGCANLVVASSTQTAEGLRRKMAREIRVLPNGADVSAFNNAMRINDGAPRDLHPIPRPRIGYIGTISQKVDVRLIANLARRRPTWHFVFVGRVLSLDALTEREQKQCAALPNVHFLGEKNVREIPLYVTNMDVNVMCYEESDHLWTKWGYPLKLHEYLAAGRPIVSADLPSIRAFEEVVRIASGVDDWEQSIEQALLHGGRGTLERRRQIAAENSWDVRVATLRAWISEMVAPMALREVRNGTE